MNFINIFKYRFHDLPYVAPIRYLDSVKDAENDEDRRGSNTAELL